MNFLSAGLAHEEVVSSLERFAKEVMPHFPADEGYTGLAFKAKKPTASTSD